MNTEQTTPTNVNAPAEQPVAKQVWETPELRSMELEDTEGGAIPGTTEDNVYELKS